ncbi:UNVERIFIED_CONTAM: Dedicator of cytokinesis protein 4 [Gekko kuhli]
MGCEIFSMWQNLGEHKVHFIPALIGPFLEVTLIPQTDLRNVMIPIFHDMMDWEQRRSGNFKQAWYHLYFGWKHSPATGRTASLEEMGFYS